ncbi:hybrid sensor histidine kinase/response regulator [Hyalangium sp.]|uniref:hybrid sensor histidine kinase/response regulator n=1 Tax=Hyalangium sp. TaxID=2028555 RepID=UPI002D676CF6|nr:response regulator [Hyalangium sp.]HYI02345.1 response regulator [Hyalangium sp.]
MTWGAASPPLRVLLVEDDPDDFILVRDALRELGDPRLSLDWVEDADEALVTMASGLHDVCLLDYRLGAHTGLELMQQARRRGARLPVILLTGNSDNEIDRQAQEAGAADFLVKSQMTPVLLERSIRYSVQHARTLEALRRSRASFRELIERLPDGVCVIHGSRISYVNPALFTLLGCVFPNELLGLEVQEVVARFFHPEEGEQVLRDLVTTQEEEGREPFRELRLVRISGESIPAELARFPVVFEGQPCTMWIARDLTERKRMQAQLVLTDRMASLGMVAGMVAHDINNPLAYVLANLHILEGDVLPRLGVTAAERTEVQELVADAQLGAARAREIVQQFRIFSRGEKEPGRQSLEVHQVIESSLRLASSEIRHRARLVRDYGDPIRIEAREVELGQVLLNLLVNAAQAIPEGSVELNEIRVVTRLRGAEAVIEIRDTGTGIPSDKLERVFEPFFTTKPNGVGTGLGLPICRNIVASLGGRLELESEVGRGSIFRIVLPAVAHPSIASLPEPARELSPGPGRRGRILIVDDEPLVSQAIRRALQREHEVMALTSAREAHARLTGGEQFDLILCDIMMPEMSGIDLHEELARVAPELAARMVFLTGGAFTARAREFLSQIKNPCVEKPFLPRDLQDLVRSLLSEGAASPA